MIEHIKLLGLGKRGLGALDRGKGGIGVAADEVDLGHEVKRAGILGKYRQALPELLLGRIVLLLEEELPSLLKLGLGRLILLDEQALVLLEADLAERPL